MLDISFFVVNVYGPNFDRKLLWDSFFTNPFIFKDSLIIGGGLNFFFGRVRVMGT